MITPDLPYPAVDYSADMGVADILEEFVCMGVDRELRLAAAKSGQFGMRTLYNLIMQEAVNVV